MTERFRDEGQGILAFGRRPVLVRCPRCHGQALFRGLYGHYGDPPRLPTLACPNCGYARAWQPPYRTSYDATDGTVEVVEGKVGKGRRVTYGQPTLLRPWLAIPCCGWVLWAFNEEHLRFLEEYVGATLRERVPRRGSTLASKLPTWMKDAKHREPILRCIARLKGALV